MNRVFHDRAEAGRRLATMLQPYAHRMDVTVLGLPRGGVPVAYEVARALEAPLDVYIVRKLGVPGHEELAMGAVAMGGVRVLNAELIQDIEISRTVVEAVVSREREELKRREQYFRGDRPPLDLQGRIVILVDDGLATGASMWAAVVGVRTYQPARVVVAIPVAAESTCVHFRREVDDVVCAMMPELFLAVGMCYEDFSQVSDEEVYHLLHSATVLPHL